MLQLTTLEIYIYLMIVVPLVGAYALYVWMGRR